MLHTETASLASLIEKVAPEENWEEALGQNPSGDCRIELEFSVGGDSVLLEGKIQGEWTQTCSRCLERHSQKLDASLQETYPLSQDVIDAAEEVRQALIMSLPSRCLCAPDCRGLCPKCGANLNQGECRCH